MATKKPAAKTTTKKLTPKTTGVKQSAALVKLKASGQEKRFAQLRKTAVNGSAVKDIAVKSPERHLTEMQQMFVRHWAAGETILTASARAGYADSGAYAYRLVKDPLVIQIYEREKKLYEASCQMTRKKVMDGFLEAADMARLQADPTALVGAWREVGKMCGYYEPVRKKIDISINGSITQKVERLDEATLLGIIRGEISSDVIDMDLNEVDEQGEPV